MNWIEGKTESERIAEARVHYAEWLARLRA